MATVNVRDYGDGAPDSAPIGTKQGVLEGVTSDLQVILITDPTSPDNIAGTELSSLKVSGVAAGTPTSVAVELSAGVTSTLADCSSAKSRVVVQNLTSAATNDPLYVGGSTVGYTSGFALLDGDNWTFDNFKGILYGISSAGITVRVSVFTYA